MAKAHLYMKYSMAPDKVVTVRLANDISEEYPPERCNGCWESIGSTVETISQTLENSKPGSKFPLFHRIGGETPISILEVSLFEKELERIREELKKLPLSESRLVKFKNGKAQVSQITSRELKSHNGCYCNGTKAKNLYESFKSPIDIHMEMCKLAKKTGTGLSWKIVAHTLVTGNGGGVKVAKPQAKLVKAAKPATKARKTVTRS